MQQKIKPDDVSKIILESNKDITMVLKAAGSSKRLIILAYLLKGPKSFSFMLDRLKVKRTAINHHLDLLLRSKLIEKEEWGRYQITEAGMDFIVNIVKSYKVISDNTQNEQEIILNEWPEWPDFLKEPRFKDVEDRRSLFSNLLRGSKIYNSELSLPKLYVSLIILPIFPGPPKSTNSKLIPIFYLLVKQFK